jgi:hypothetical protein
MIDLDGIDRRAAAGLGVRRAEVTELVARVRELESVSALREFDLQAAQTEALVRGWLLAELVVVVRRERDARAEWLASLPDGSCSNPPPRALLDAEAATGDALRSVDSLPW